MTLTSPLVMHRLSPLGGPLAGREEEMDILRRAWAEAAGGERRMVLLAGEAGVGKTRLAAELADEADGTGAVVLVGHCPVGGAEPYHPLSEALGPLPTGLRDREALLDTLVDVVATRAWRTPVLLVLDDLHRADRSTLLAVRRLVEVPVDLPLLVVGTYRDASVDRSHPIAEFLTAVLARPEVERINVEGLEPEGVAEMVGDSELGLRLWRRSAGNPVTVAELLRPGALDRPLPSTFEEMVARRVAALSPRARSFVEAAAVAGPEFRVGVVADAAGMSGERATAVLRELAGSGFVVEEPGGSDDTRRFVHDMVREAVTRGVDAAARVQLHREIGRALAAFDDVPAALVAWHFRAAAPVGSSARALRHSARAGERAMELLAWDEAAVHFGHALAAAAGAAPQSRADLLMSLGEAQRLAGEGARARQAFLEAAAIASACSDGARMARAALALGHITAVWGADRELEAVAGEARSLLGRAAVKSAASRPPVDFASGDLYDVLDGVEPVANDPAPVDSPPAPPAPARGHVDAAALLRARHVALAGPEHAGERLAAAEEMVALATRTGDDELTATGLGWRMADALDLGRMERVVMDQEAHAAITRRLAGTRAAADAAAWSAMRAMLDGQVDDSRTATAKAFALAEQAGDPVAGSSFLVQRWWLALDWASPDELSDVIEECRSRAFNGANARTWRAVLALALARVGRLDLAAEELRRVTDHGLGELVRDPGRLHPLACLAEVAWMLGDGYRAAIVGPLVEPFADRLVVAGRALVCQGSAARVCGLVAASAHRWDDADRHFHAALAVHRSIGALPLLARTQFEWSRVLRQRDRKIDRRRANDFRRKAVDLATDLGMHRLLEEIAGEAT